jgi:hypothetical protein
VCGTSLPFASTMEMLENSRRKENRQRCTKVKFENINSNGHIKQMIIITNQYN